MENEYIFSKNYCHYSSFEPKDIEVGSTLIDCGDGWYQHYNKDGSVADHWRLRVSKVETLVYKGVLTVKNQMKPKEIAEKHVYGKHDALTDKQEVKDMIADIEAADREKLISYELRDIYLPSSSSYYRAGKIVDDYLKTK